MHDLKLEPSELAHYLRPDTWFGAAIYLAIFVSIAMLLSRLLRTAVHAMMTRKGHVDLTTISFLKQMATALIWTVMLILYAHLIPVLRSIGTALLAGASIASVVIGLAAQSTLGNLVAGLAITIYRPFRLGDRLQVATPTGTEIGTVELISLGYTTLSTADGRLVVLPNSVVSSQVTLNLTAMHADGSFPITIRVPRAADYAAVERRCRAIAEETLGPDCVAGLYLKEIDTSTAVFVLHVRNATQQQPDSLKGKLIAALEQGFRTVEAEPGDRPAFS